MKQVLICVPEALCDVANAFMIAAGYGPEDGNTFTACGFTHSTGTYSVAAFRASEHWLGRLTAPLAAPYWPVDLDAARLGQSLLMVFDTSQQGPPPEPRDDGILVLLGVPGRGVLDQLGLSRI